MPGIRPRRLLSALTTTTLVLAGTAVAAATPAPAAPAPKPVPKPPTAPAEAKASPRSAKTVRLTPTATPVTTLAAAPNVAKGTGPARNATFVSLNLSDTLTAEINVGSGNLLLRSRDLTLPGVGADLPLGATYNSLLVGSGVDSGAFGPGWRTSTGSDVRLVAADDGTVTYVAADGAVGVFNPSGSTSYTGAREFKAVLTRVPGSGWTLQENETGRKLTFTSSGTLDKWSDRNGNVTDVALVSSGREGEIVSTRGGYNSRRASVTWSGGLLSSYIHTGDDGTGRATTYGYTGGRLSSITHPSTRVAHFSYDGAGNIVSITVSASWGDERRTTLTYDSSHRVTSLTQVTDLPTGYGATTRLTYPSTTQTLVADANTDLSVPVSSGAFTAYTIDSDKRVTASYDPEGYERTTTYTQYKDVAKTTGAEGGSVTQVYGANNGQSLTASYPSTSTSAGASTVTYDNAATSANPTAGFQATSVKNRDGNTMTYAYNGPGNLVTGTDAAKAAAAVDYNDDGTISSATDPGNGSNRTWYDYDGNKQLTDIWPVEGSSLGHRAYTYDTWGRLATATDGAGHTIEYHYDADDHVVSAGYSDGTGWVDTYYDAAGNVYQRGDGLGDVHYAYDALNRLTSRSASTGGGALAYEHDPAGNLIRLTDGRGSTAYDYDERNLLTEMITAGGTRYGFEYDEDGRRTVTYFKLNSAWSSWAVKTAVTYDATGRIKRMTTTRNSASPVTVSDISTCYTPYSYNGSCSSTAADRAAVQWDYNHLTSTRSDYTYNSSGRLISATNAGGATWGYAYDTNGNRKTVSKNGSTTQSLNFNAANQVSNSGNSYDGAGNQLTGAGQNQAPLGYNAASQMVTAGGDTYEYTGGTQLEVTKAASTDLVYGAPDQFGQPWLQSYAQNYDDGSTTVGYIERDPATGQPLGVAIDGTDHFYGVNRLGSVTSMVNTSSSVAATYTYDPYGAITATSGGLAESNPIRFTGAYQDTVWGAGTGFVKLGHRWYNAGQGRFTQQDALSLIGDPSVGNRYAYTNGDPVNNIDPAGRCSVAELTVGVVSGVGGLLFGLTTTAVVLTTITTAGLVLLLGGLFAASFLLGMCIAEKTR